MDTLKAAGEANSLLMGAAVKASLIVDPNSIYTETFN